MVAVARHLGWERPSLARGRSANAPGRAARRASTRHPADRAALRLAAIGFASLAGLPVLLIASLVLEAPLAAPAAIALGHFAAARAASRGETRKAAGWSLAVLVGLLGWTIAFFAGSGDLSLPELAAVLSAPALAVAPLCAGLIGRRDNEAGRRARADAACLESLAPAEALLFVDGQATILAGTRAGFAALHLSPSAAGTDIAEAIAVVDRPGLLNAIAICAGGSEPAALSATVAGGGGVSLSLSPSQEDAIAVRIGAIARPMAAASETPAEPPPPADHEPRNPPPECDAAHAIGFAIRKIAPKAMQKGVTLTCGGLGRTQLAGEPALCRRIFALAIEAAVSASLAGSAIRVSARKVRGAALVRIGCAAGDEDAGAALQRLDETMRRAGLAELVDAARGTVLAEIRDGAAGMSIRLALGREARKAFGPASERGAA